MLSAVFHYDGDGSNHLNSPLAYSSVTGAAPGQTTPLSGDTIEFAGPNTNVVNDLPTSPTNTVLGFVEFQSGGFSIGGQNPLTVAGTIEVDGGFSASIAAPVALHGSVTCDVEPSARWRSTARSPTTGAPQAPWRRPVPTAR